MPTLPEPSGKPVVIVIDDDDLVRDSLDSLFRSVRFSVISYSSALEFLETDLPDGPACLVMDVRLPRMGGFECLHHLRERGTEIPAVFLTGHGDIHMSVKAMKAGAVDFLTKPFRDQDVLDAVSSGLARSAAQHSRVESTRCVRERFERLSPRERQVMEGVILGRLNKQIAGDIGISEITVKLHRSSMMKKMALRTVPDLVRAADQLHRLSEETRLAAAPEMSSWIAA